MDYQDDLEMDQMEFECCLRENIFKSKEFQELFPNLDIDSIKYSKEEQEALDLFKQQKEKIHDKLKVEIEVNFALITLDRRCHIEVYKRLDLPSAKRYWDKEDLITVCSNEDLIVLLGILKRLRLGKEYLGNERRRRR